MNLKISALFLIATCLVDFGSAQSCLPTKGLGKWVRARDGVVPDNAVAGGLEKDRVQYICRSGGIPGKIMDGSPCYYAYYNEESYDDSYDVLTGVTGVWVPIDVTGGNFPCNSMKTGTAANIPLYSCRVMYKNYLTLGKVQDNVCSIGYRGDIHKYKKNFEIFAAVTENVQLSRNNDITFNADGKYFAFQLKADDEAVVTLGNGGNMLYSVAIGALDNSVVSVGPANSKYDNFKPAAGILSSSEFKSYWIRWNGDKLEFGKEGVLKPLITYKNKGVKDINSIRLSSTFGDSEWKIPLLASQ